MRTVDHRILAGSLIDMIGKDGYIPEIYKKAFIIGSIEPDKNLLTYLHGFLGGRKLHGHDYENILPMMKRLYDMLSEKKVFGLKDYYRLGKLLHYTADAFTYPHNSIFTGSLAAHVICERKLHEKFCAAVSEVRSTEQIRLSAEKFEDMQDLHFEYMQSAGGYEWDCRYILQASSMVMAQFAEHHAGAHRRGALDLCREGGNRYGI